jgi:hypothetical protein
VGAPVWGTFSVRDHCHEEAFAREALLFDSLVIPYPDPDVPGEYERWRQPNPNDPSESWDPERLDELLTVLGTKENPGHNGAKLAVTTKWSPATWSVVKSRLETASALTGDPYRNTSLGLREWGLPRLVEAVAAYRSEEDWRTEVQPLTAPPADISGAEALIQLSRPLLLPKQGRGGELEMLRRVVDVAADPDFGKMRTAYHDWLRDVIEPLRTEGAWSLEDLKLDPSSLKEAQDRLNTLWEQEKKLVLRADRRKFWTRVEVSVTTLGTAAAVGLAIAGALPLIGAGAVLLPFAGWAMSKWQLPNESRNLGGASIFIEAQRRLHWTEPSLVQG